MPTLQNTAFAAADTVLSTELNSLANNGITANGPELNVTTGRQFAGVLDLELGSFDTSAQTFPGIEVYAVMAAADGVTYPAEQVTRSDYMLTIPVSAANSAKKVYGYGPIYLAPGKYKFYAVNKTGVVLNAAGNSIKLRRFSAESV